MRRLSLTIFLSLLASLTLMALAVSWAWRWQVAQRAEERENRFTEALAAEVIPAAADGVPRLRAALHHWHRRLRVDLQVMDADGRVLAAAGRPFGADGQTLDPRSVRPADGGPDGRGTRDMRTGAAGAEPPAFVEDGPAGDFRGGHADDGRAGRGRAGRGPGDEHPAPEGGYRPRVMEAVVHQVALPDARTLRIRSWRPVPPRSPVSAPVALALLFVAVGLAAWPVSRRITRRLEALQHIVDRQAAGDLKIRAAVQGHDEVAALAESFNRAAARIEELVGRQEALLTSQRRLLAHASHELRSPLARIRMATELMMDDPAGAGGHAGEVRQSIHELDELVEEILLASRLDTDAGGEGPHDPVDIVALAAEEAARVEAELQVQGDIPAEIPGELRLLRRLLRNLLENARRYHPPGGEPVLLSLVSSPEGLRMTVSDRGPGVPAAARERIFEAFYRVDGHSEQAGNVGLGLSLVRQIVRRHGGEVRHQPREGGGSHFVVTLPLH
ncbi:MAG: HAMP domain-containing sensor histidine kinase [Lautropia sp.]|nr:HAMP domain-containing sensor histidine kinase [Lautropia sp.]